MGGEAVGPVKAQFPNVEEFEGHEVGPAVGPCLAFVPHFCLFWGHDVGVGGWGNTLIEAGGGGMG